MLVVVPDVEDLTSCVVCGGDPLLTVLSDLAAAFSSVGKGRRCMNIIGTK